MARGIPQSDKARAAHAAGSVAGGKSTSPLKALAAIANGAAPCKDGKRRGRPPGVKEATPRRKLEPGCPSSPRGFHRYFKNGCTCRYCGYVRPKWVAENPLRTELDT